MSGICFTMGLLFLSSPSYGWNPIMQLHPDDLEQLAKSGVEVKYLVVQRVPFQREYHFSVSAPVVSARWKSSSLEISHVVYEAKRESGYLQGAASWRGESGRCTANFVVDEKDLRSSRVHLQYWNDNQRGTRVAFGGYTFEPAEFARDPRFRRLLFSPRLLDVMHTSPSFGWHDGVPAQVF